jgi:hypothetical protein
MYGLKLRVIIDVIHISLLVILKAASLLESHKRNIGMTYRLELLIKLLFK